jgi:alanine-synthesizing transaminase
MSKLQPSKHLANVRYEIRGPLARRADELERKGYDIIKLNIGNPAAFGFRTPESMRLAVIENLREAEGYCHQKGIFPAREAVAADAQTRGIRGVTPDDVFVGNGVSELILMTMEALLEPGDEVLVPSPDYPLWTAAISLTGATPVHYPCRHENGFAPDPAEIAKLVTPRCKALVVINPNNPTGAVYSRAVLEGLVAIAATHGLVCFSDEIYDRVLYDGAEHIPLATIADDVPCATFGGLSKVYRACGLRTGWVYVTGRRDGASEYLRALELLASLRLCANVPGQWAVQTALGGRQSIHDLTAPNGRLGRQRRAVLRGVEQSPHLEVIAPRGALYAFVRVTSTPSGFSDRALAMTLLEREHLLVVPGSSFNVDYTDHVRVTFLPEEETLDEVFRRINRLMDAWMEGRLEPSNALG